MTTVIAPSPTVVLLGNPNTGKSTLFTALAGVFQQTGNYPGVTVEKKSAALRLGGRDFTLVDLPGTYSLSPRSPDEMVAVDVLLGRVAEHGIPRVVVSLVDAANLERNLFLTTQLLSLGLPVVVALNMGDVARERGITIDAKLLSERLGTPVVEIQANQSRGLEELRRAILAAVDAPTPAPVQVLPPEIHSAAERLSTAVERDTGERWPLFLIERSLLDTSGYLDHVWDTTNAETRRELAEVRAELTAGSMPLNHAEAIARYGWIGKQLVGVSTRAAERPVTWSDRLDRVLTHRFWGLVVFGVMMLGLFATIFWVAAPVMTLIDDGVGVVKDWVSASMDPGPLRSLLTVGIIGGVGGVIIFVPQIMLLFLFIALFEDCGYMARAAYLMDRLMSRVGLSGKSFIPLLSSFACAIPGVMATRTIENRRDRLTTMLIAPLMSCSARLPVYSLLTFAFIPSDQFVLGFIPLTAVVFLAMYLLGIVAAVVVALVLKRTMLKGETPPFVMELPAYKRPSLKIALIRMVHQAWQFIKNAGTIIFAVSILIWAALYYPHGDGQDSPEVQAALQAQRADLNAKLISSQAADHGPRDLLVDLAELDPSNQAYEKHQLGQARRDSYLGRVGQFIEPVVKPLGWDWRLGCAVIASFPAREVVIGTLGVIYDLGEDVDTEEDEGRTAMERKLQEATWDGTNRKVFTLPVALSVMVFFALCAQCAATLAVIKRETGTWGWPIFTFVYMTVLAYVAALLTYQIGTWWMGS
jgi:ferrous iron transport protein B